MKYWQGQAAEVNTEDCHVNSANSPPLHHKARVRQCSGPWWIERSQHRANGKLSRIDNGHLKRKERANRDKRMKEIILKGSWPFTPAIMSWVSTQLGKPASQVSETEVWRLVGK